MIRPYTVKDQPRLIEILRLNTPKYFDKSEEKDLIEYLNNDSKNYFVVEKFGLIIGAGGFNLGFDEGKTARISWDFIDPNYQGQSIGSELTNYRIEQIKNDPKIELIVVRTTQLTHKFYEKMGFSLTEIVPDYWAVGFDLYHMEIRTK